MRTLLGILVFIGAVATAETRTLYIGTTGRGEAKGIYRAEFDLSSGELSAPELAAEAPNPGFLTLAEDGRFLYATSSIPPARQEPPVGAVAAFAVEDDGGLRELGRRECGKGPCFVALDATGRTLLAANYGGGSVASFPVEDDGSLAPRASYFRHEGSSVNEQRQKGPHAHSFYAGPDNRFAYAPDLGIDEVVIYALDPAAGKVTRAGTAKTPPGSGPRHMKFGRDGKQAYVLGELSLEVIVYDRDAESGALARTQVVSVLPDDADGDGMTCSEILVSPDGRHVYTANRDTAGKGRDSLTMLAVGEDGKLGRVQTVPAEVSIPRNIQLGPDGRWLLVAGQQSGGVPVFRVAGDGKLAFSGHRADVPGAMCLVFAP